MLSDFGVELLARPDDVPDVDETADTLEGNALLKARALASRDRGARARGRHGTVRRRARRRARGA